MPLLSVIMYLKNGEKSRAKKAINSVLNQSISDVEFLILSEKEHFECIESINDVKIKIIEHTGSKAEALKSALNMASGKFVAKMEANGLSEPERFEKQLKILEANNETGLVGCWFQRKDKNGNVIESHEPEAAHTSIVRSLLDNNCFSSGSIMFRKNCAKDAGGYNEKLDFFPDYDLCMKIALKHKLTTVVSYSYSEEISVFEKVLFQISIFLKKAGVTLDREFLLRRVNKILHTVRCKHFHKKDVAFYTKKQREKNSIRENFIEKSANSLETTSNSLSAYPYNDFLYYNFIKQFDKEKCSSSTYNEELSLFFNKICCLRYPYDAAYFDMVSEIFTKIEKPHLSFLCDLKSLDIEPYSKFVYERVKEYIEKPLRLNMTLAEKETCMVSVIMPTYNRGATIKESIDSLLNQTFNDFELILINDGGNDEVEEKVREINSKHIKYFKIKHKGLQGALNEGLKVAQGKYIAYLDDDDIYLPQHLEKLVKLIENQKVDMVYAKSRIIKGRYEGQEFIREREGGTHSEAYSKEKLHNGCIISTLNVMHKRAALAQIGGFNEQLPWSMDWDLWVRFSEVFNIKFLDEFTGEYRETGQNMTVRKAYKGMFYKNILSNFYTSNNGLSILTHAAYTNKDERTLEKYQEKLLKNLQILSREQFKKLLILNISRKEELYSPLVSRLIEHDYALFVKAVLSSRRLFVRYLFSKLFVKRTVEYLTSPDKSC